MHFWRHVLPVYLKISVFEFQIVFVNRLSVLRSVGKSRLYIIQIICGLLLRKTALYVRSVGSCCEPRSVVSEDDGGAASSEKDAQQLIGKISKQVVQLDKRWNDLNHSCRAWQSRLDEVLEVSPWCCYSQLMAMLLVFMVTAVGMTGQLLLMVTAVCITEGQLLLLVTAVGMTEGQL